MPIKAITATHVLNAIGTPFRFWDFPVELRYMVYEELLVIGKVYFKYTKHKHNNSIRYKDKAYDALPI